MYLLISLLCAVGVSTGRIRFFITCANILFNSFSDYFSSSEPSNDEITHTSEHSSSTSSEMINTDALHFLHRVVFQSLSRFLRISSLRALPLSPSSIKAPFVLSLSHSHTPSQTPSEHPIWGLACDGHFLFVHCPGAIARTGTGFGGTLAGRDTHSADTNDASKHTLDVSGSMPSTIIHKMDSSSSSDTNTTQPLYDGKEWGECDIHCLTHPQPSLVIIHHSSAEFFTKQPGTPNTSSDSANLSSFSVCSMYDSETLTSTERCFVSDSLPLVLSQLSKEIKETQSENQSQAQSLSLPAVSFIQLPSVFAEAGRLCGFSETLRDILTAGVPLSVLEHSRNRRFYTIMQGTSGSDEDLYATYNHMYLIESRNEPPHNPKSAHSAVPSSQPSETSNQNENNSSSSQPNSTNSAQNSNTSDANDSESIEEELSESFLLEQQYEAEELTQDATDSSASDNKLTSATTQSVHTCHTPCKCSSHRQKMKQKCELRMFTADELRQMGYSEVTRMITDGRHLIHIGTLIRYLDDPVRFLLVTVFERHQFTLKASSPTDSLIPSFGEWRVQKRFLIDARTLTLTHCCSICGHSLESTSKCYHCPTCYRFRFHVAIRPYLNDTPMEREHGRPSDEQNRLNEFILNGPSSASASSTLNKKTTGTQSNASSSDPPSNPIIPDVSTLPVSSHLFLICNDCVATGRCTGMHTRFHPLAQAEVPLSWHISSKLLQRGPVFSDGNTLSIFNVRVGETMYTFPLSRSIEELYTFNCLDSIEGCVDGCTCDCSECASFRSVHSSTSSANEDTTHSLSSPLAPLLNESKCDIPLLENLYTAQYPSLQRDGIICFDISHNVVLWTPEKLVPKASHNLYIFPLELKHVSPFDLLTEENTILHSYLSRIPMFSKIGTWIISHLDSFSLKDTFLAHSVYQTDSSVHALQQLLGTSEIQWNNYEHKDTSAASLLQLLYILKTGALFESSERYQFLYQCILSTFLLKHASSFLYYSQNYQSLTDEQFLVPFTPFITDSSSELVTQLTQLLSYLSLHWQTLPQIKLDSDAESLEKQFMYVLTSIALREALYILRETLFTLSALPFSLSSLGISKGIQEKVLHVLSDIVKSSNKALGFSASQHSDFNFTSLQAHSISFTRQLALEALLFGCLAFTTSSPQLLHVVSQIISLSKQNIESPDLSTSLTYHTSSSRNTLFQRVFPSIFMKIRPLLFTSLAYPHRFTINGFASTRFLPHIHTSLKYLASLNTSNNSSNSDASLIIHSKNASNNLFNSLPTTAVELFSFWDSLIHTEHIYSLMELKTAFPVSLRNSNTELTSDYFFDTSSAPLLRSFLLTFQLQLFSLFYRFRPPFKRDTTSSNKQQHIPSASLDPSFNVIFPFFYYYSSSVFRSACTLLTETLSLLNNISPSHSAQLSHRTILSVLYRCTVGRLARPLLPMIYLLVQHSPDAAASFLAPTFNFLQRFNEVLSAVYALDKKCVSNNNAVKQHSSSLALVNEQLHILRKTVSPTVKPVTFKIETDHPYQNNEDWKDVIYVPQAIGYKFKFDPQCKTELKYDFCTICVPTQAQLAQAISSQDQMLFTSQSSSSTSFCKPYRISASKEPDGKRICMFTGTSFPKTEFIIMAPALVFTFLSDKSGVDWGIDCEITSIMPEHTVDMGGFITAGSDESLVSQLINRSSSPRLITQVLNDDSYEQAAVEDSKQPTKSSLYKKDAQSLLSHHGSQKRQLEDVGKGLWCVEVAHLASCIWSRSISVIGSPYPLPITALADTLSPLYSIPPSTVHSDDQSSTPALTSKRTFMELSLFEPTLLRIHKTLIESSLPSLSHVVDTIESYLASHFSKRESSLQHPSFYDIPSASFLYTIVISITDEELLTATNNCLAELHIVNHSSEDASTLKQSDSSSSSDNVDAFEFLLNCFQIPGFIRQLLVYHISLQYTLHSLNSFRLPHDSTKSLHEIASTAQLNSATHHNPFYITLSLLELSNGFTSLTRSLSKRFLLLQTLESPHDQIDTVQTSASSQSSLLYSSVLSFLKNIVHLLDSEISAFKDELSLNNSQLITHNTVSYLTWLLPSQILMCTRITSLLLSLNEFAPLLNIYSSDKELESIMKDISSSLVNIFELPQCSLSEYLQMKGKAIALLENLMHSSLSASSQTTTPSNDAKDSHSYLDILLSSLLTAVHISAQTFEVDRFGTSLHIRKKLDYLCNIQSKAQNKNSYSIDDTQQPSLNSIGSASTSKISPSTDSPFSVGHQSSSSTNIKPFNETIEKNTYSATSSADPSSSLQYSDYTTSIFAIDDEFGFRSVSYLLSLLQNRPQVFSEKPFVNESSHILEDILRLALSGSPRIQRLALRSLPLILLNSSASSLSSDGLSDRRFSISITGIKLDIVDILLTLIALPLFPQIQYLLPNDFDYEHASDSLKDKNPFIKLFLNLAYSSSFGVDSSMLPILDILGESEEFSKALDESVRLLSSNSKSTQDNDLTRTNNLFSQILSDLLAFPLNDITSLLDEDNGALNMMVTATAIDPTIVQVGRSWLKLLKTHRSQQKRANTQSTPLSITPETINTTSTQVPYSLSPFRSQQSPTSSNSENTSSASSSSSLSSSSAPASALSPAPSTPFPSKTLSPFNIQPQTANSSSSNQEEDNLSSVQAVSQKSAANVDPVIERRLSLFWKALFSFFFHSYRLHTASSIQSIALEASNCLKLLISAKEPSSASSVPSAAQTLKTNLLACLSEHLFKFPDSFSTVFPWFSKETDLTSHSLNHPISLPMIESLLRNLTVLDLFSGSFENASNHVYFYPGQRIKDITNDSTGTILRVDSFSPVAAVIWDPSARPLTVTGVNSFRVTSVPLACLQSLDRYNSLPSVSETIPVEFVNRKGLSIMLLLSLSTLDRILSFLSQIKLYSNQIQVLLKQALLNPAPVLNTEHNSIILSPSNSVQLSSSCLNSSRFMISLVLASRANMAALNISCEILSSIASLNTLGNFNDIVNLSLSAVASYHTSTHENVLSWFTSIISECLSGNSLSNNSKADSDTSIVSFHQSMSKFCSSRTRRKEFLITRFPFLYPTTESLSATLERHLSLEHILAYTPRFLRISSDTSLKIQSASSQSQSSSASSSSDNSKAPSANILPPQKKESVVSDATLSSWETSFFHIAVTACLCLCRRCYCLSVVRCTCGEILSNPQQLRKNNSSFKCGTCGRISSLINGSVCGCWSKKSSAQHPYRPIESRKKSESHLKEKGSTDFTSRDQMLAEQSKSFFFATLNKLELEVIAKQAKKSFADVSTALLHCPQTSIARFPVCGVDQSQHVLEFDIHNSVFVQPSRVLGTDVPEDEATSKLSSVSLPPSFFRHPALSVNPEILFKKPQIAVSDKMEKKFKKSKANKAARKGKHRVLTKYAYVDSMMKRLMHARDQSHINMRDLTRTIVTHARKMKMSDVRPPIDDLPMDDPAESLSSLSSSSSSDSECPAIPSPDECKWEILPCFISDSTIITLFEYFPQSKEIRRLSEYKFWLDERQRAESLLQTATSQNTHTASSSVIIPQSNETGDESSSSAQPSSLPLITKPIPQSLKDLVALPFPQLPPLPLSLVETVVTSYSTTMVPECMKDWLKGASHGNRGMGKSDWFHFPPHITMVFLHALGLHPGHRVLVVSTDPHAVPFSACRLVYPGGYVVSSFSALQMTYYRSLGSTESSTPHLVKSFSQQTQCAPGESPLKGLLRARKSSHSTSIVCTCQGRCRYLPQTPEGERYAGFINDPTIVEELKSCTCTCPHCRGRLPSDYVECILPMNFIPLVEPLLSLTPVLHHFDRILFTSPADNRCILHALSLLDPSSDGARIVLPDQKEHTICTIYPTHIANQLRMRGSFCSPVSAAAACVSNHGPCDNSPLPTDTLPRHLQPRAKPWMYDYEPPLYIRGFPKAGVASIDESLATRILRNNSVNQRVATLKNFNEVFAQFKGIQPSASPYSLPDSLYHHLPFAIPPDIPTNITPDMLLGNPFMPFPPPNPVIPPDIFEPPFSSHAPSSPSTTPPKVDYPLKITVELCDISAARKPGSMYLPMSIFSPPQADALFSNVASLQEGICNSYARPHIGIKHQANNTAEKKAKQLVKLQRIHPFYSISKDALSLLMKVLSPSASSTPFSDAETLPREFFRVLSSGLLHSLEDSVAHCVTEDKAKILLEISRRRDASMADDMCGMVTLHCPKCMLRSNELFCISCFVHCHDHNGTLSLLQNKDDCHRHDHHHTSDSSSVLHSARAAQINSAFCDCNFSLHRKWPCVSDMLVPPSFSLHDMLGPEYKGPDGLSGGIIFKSFKSHPEVFAEIPGPGDHIWCSPEMECFPPFFVGTKVAMEWAQKGKYVVYMGRLLDNTPVHTSDSSESSLAPLSPPVIPASVEKQARFFWRDATKNLQEADSEEKQEKEALRILAAWIAEENNRIEQYNAWIHQQDNTSDAAVDLSLSPITSIFNDDDASHNQTAETYQENRTTQNLRYSTAAHHSHSIASFRKFISDKTEKLLGGNDSDSDTSDESYFHSDEDDEEEEQEEEEEEEEEEEDDETDDDTYSDLMPESSKRKSRSRVFLYGQNLFNTGKSTLSSREQSKNTTSKVLDLTNKLSIFGEPLPYVNIKSEKQVTKRPLSKDNLLWSILSDTQNDLSTRNSSLQSSSIDSVQRKRLTSSDKRVTYLREASHNIQSFISNSSNNANLASSTNNTPDTFLQVSSWEGLFSLPNFSTKEQSLPLQHTDTLGNDYMLLEMRSLLQQKKYDKLLYNRIVSAHKGVYENGLVSPLLSLNKQNQSLSSPTNRFWSINELTTATLFQMHDITAGSVTTNQTQPTNTEETDNTFDLDILFGNEDEAMFSSVDSTELEKDKANESSTALLKPLSSSVNTKAFEHTTSKATIEDVHKSDDSINILAKRLTHYSDDCTCYPKTLSEILSSVNIPSSNDTSLHSISSEAETALSSSDSLFTELGHLKDSLPPATDSKSSSDKSYDVSLLSAPFLHPLSSLFVPQLPHSVCEYSPLRDVPAFAGDLTGTRFAPSTLGFSESIRSAEEQRAISAKRVFDATSIHTTNTSESFDNTSGSSTSESAVTTREDFDALNPLSQQQYIMSLKRYRLGQLHSLGVRQLTKDESVSLSRGSIVLLSPDSYLFSSRGVEIQHSASLLMGVVVDVAPGEGVDRHVVVKISDAERGTERLVWTSPSQFRTFALPLIHLHSSQTGGASELDQNDITLTAKSDSASSAQSSSNDNSQSNSSSPQVINKSSSFHRVETAPSILTRLLF